MGGYIFYHLRTFYLRDVDGQSGISEPAGLNIDVARNVASMNDTMETEENLTDNEKPLHGTPNPEMDYDVDEDLEDSEDEMAYSEPSTSVVNRRRMVVDVEDDD